MFPRNAGRFLTRLQALACLLVALGLCAALWSCEGSAGWEGPSAITKDPLTPGSGFGFCPYYGSPWEVPASMESLSERGPYGFATRDFTFVDVTRPTPPNDGYAGAPERTLPTRVWYPACPPEAAASPPPSSRVPVASGGTFPLLAYAHGLTNLGNNARHVAEHLASHGYIVAAPLFPLTRGGAPGGPTIGDAPNQPADLEFVLNQVAQLGGADADLADAVDPARRGIMGFSAGGLAVLLAAYHPTLKIEGIQAAVAMAPVSCFLGPGLYGRSLPTLILSGTADELVPPEGPRMVFLQAPPPVTLVELLGGTHSGFMNLEVPFVANSDTMECERLLTFTPTAGNAALEAGITAGAGPNAFNLGTCPTLCGQRLTQTMGATRQLRLVRAATLAHFEAELKGRQDAEFFLTQLLDLENPDVNVLDKP